MTNSEYQTSGSCTYYFSKPGKYVVVVWVKNKTTDSNEGVPIIGTAVDIRASNSTDSSCQINFDKFSISGIREVGMPVIFSMDVDNECSGNTYFRYSVHPGYGTDGYDGLHWESMTASEYTTENSIEYTFGSAGGSDTKYIVVVWAKNDTSDSNTGVPIIGVSVEISEGSNTSDCGAYVAPGVWKEFDCYNLGAIGKTTDDDPFTPSWRLIGGYWQWGRTGPDSDQWYDSNSSNFAHGPTGSRLEEANESTISGWNNSYADDESWSDSQKTDADPCPAGYRVPTMSQWQGVDANNIQRTVGTWSESTTNYTSGLFFGSKLFLPAAGSRALYSGSLGSRGYYGNYWSSTQSSGVDAWHLNFFQTNANLYRNHRNHGFSVRCVAE